MELEEGNKMLRTISIVFAFLMISACVAPEPETTGNEALGETVLEAASESEKTSPEGDYKYTPVRFELSSRDDEPSAEEIKQCEDVGGAVQRAGLAGYYHCVQEYPDAGKVCSDSSECEGTCRTQSSEAVGKPGTGTCQEVDVAFGCFAMVSNGVVDGGMLCVD